MPQSVSSKDLGVSTPVPRTVPGFGGDVGFTPWSDSATPAADLTPPSTAERETAGEGATEVTEEEKKNCRQKFL